MKESRKGMLMVISGPSGTGKGTLAGRLLNDSLGFAFSVSCTTRGIRSNEIADVHYHFITRERFEELIAQDAFLEHAEVHGNHYGTLKSEVEERIAQGINVLLDIDTQGALNVIRSCPDCVSVFILPPSMAELRARLEGRATDAPEVIERRLQNAKGEIEKLDHYRYAIVNDDIDTAYAQLRAIAVAEAQKVTRYSPALEDLT